MLYKKSQDEEEYDTGQIHGAGLVFGVNMCLRSKPEESQSAKIFLRIRAANLQYILPRLS